MESCYLFEPSPSKSIDLGRYFVCCNTEETKFHIHLQYQRQKDIFETTHQDLRKRKYFPSVMGIPPYVLVFQKKSHILYISLMNP